MYTGANIVRNGLVLALDAANTKSYVSGSTVWNDLSGNNNTGILVNGPTFSSANNGSIVFDGTNDYFSVSIPLILSSHTVISWAYFNSLDKTWLPIIEFGSGSEYRAHYYVQGNLNSNINQRQGFGANWTNNGATDVSTWTSPNLSSVSTNTWYMLTGRLDGTLGDTYINLNKSKATKTGISYANVPTTAILNSRVVESFYNSGLVSNVLLYNRALSDLEILQNYNALKSRFNL